jgi:hypothetical protein
MACPAFPAIEAAVNIAAIRRTGHPVWLALIEGQSKHGMGRLQAHFDADPGLAPIRASLQNAKITLEIQSSGHPKLSRIAGHLVNIAAIDLALGIDRLQRHVAPVISPVRAVEHTGSPDPDHRIRPPPANQHTVHVHRIVIDGIGRGSDSPSALPHRWSGWCRQPQLQRTTTLGR